VTAAARGRVRRTVMVVAAFAAAACTDPRARPVAPIVRLSFAPTFRLTSPGTIAASLYMFDTDGLQSLDLSVRSLDSTFVGDSSLFLSGAAEITRPVTWTVPAGLATGTAVTVRARVLDFTGFATADSVQILVQDSVLGGQ